MSWQIPVVVLALTILLMVALIGLSVYSNPVTAGLSVGISVLGVPVYFLAKISRKADCCQKFSGESLQTPEIKEPPHFFPSSIFLLFFPAAPSATLFPHQEYVFSYMKEHGHLCCRVPDKVDSDTSVGCARISAIWPRCGACKTAAGENRTPFMCNVEHNANNRAQDTRVIDSPS